MVDSEIFFIFGAPRSGTTYANALLRSHFDVGLCSEGEWVVRLGRRSRRFGDLRIEANLQRLLDEVLRSEMFELFRTKYSEHYGRPMDLTLEEIRDRLCERSFPGVVYAVFRAAADRMGCSRVGNKYPGYWTFLEPLHLWFPKAKFLHVVRDGRDVALSTMAIRWGQKTAYACAREWVRAQEAAHALSSKVSADSFLTLYYEPLLSHPESVLPLLEGFFGCELGDAGREAFLREVRENPKRNNFGHWRRRLPERDVAVFEAVAGDWLRRHAYPCATGGRKLSWIDRAKYQAEEMALQLKRRVRRKGPERSMAATPAATGS